MKELIILALMLSLTACALFEEQTAPTVATSCPSIKHYTAEELAAQAKAEMDLPINTPLAEPLLEWRKLRGELEKCQRPTE